MQIITEPTVTVVAATQFIPHPKYAIPPGGTDAERIGAFSGKGCYDSYGVDGRGVLENQRQIISSMHGSVLEHASASLFIEGITRGLSLELNRHRHFAISQRSTRYTEESEAAIVLEPYYAETYADLYGYITNWTGHRDCPPGQPHHQMVYTHLLQQQQAITAYAEEVECLLELNPLQLTGTELRKWARGKARNLLPHGLETRGTYTANYRTWRHFLELRSERHAEAEIRRLAGHCYDVLAPLAPTYFEDYTVTVVHGLREFTPAYRKI